ncbi:MAG: ATP-binding protein [Candidatus Nanohaloarchaea archaeon]|nr:ATP-binding protein [Candidatus Nanohaloarchaea archaeon]
MKREDILTALNDWNLWGSYRDDSLERPTYLNRLESLAETGEIVAVKGVRRAGKSTLLHQFLRNKIEVGLDDKNTLFIKLDDPRLSGADLEDLNRIYEVYQEEVQPDALHYVVLDEAQMVEGWEKFANLIHEAKNARILVTGSSSHLLSEEYSTLLSGRHVSMEVFPLSFGEFLHFNEIKPESETDLVRERHKIKKLLREYLEWGGFPKVALVDEPQKRQILTQYFDDILIKDVQERFNIRKTGKLKEVARNYLSDISNLKSYSSVSNAVDVSLDTIERFSHYLSIARILFFVQKFAYSHKKQVLNPRKVYCIDPGLRNVGGFRFSRDAGAILENIVFLELYRNHEEVYYWKGQKETDFVVKEGEDIVEIVQVCYNMEDEETQNREIEAILEASEKFNCDKLSIITFEREDILDKEGKKIEVKSAWKWLSLQE